MENNKIFWNKTAFFYRFFMKSNKSLYIKISSILEEYLNEDMNILELACGTGQITFLLADKVNSWEATDFSENMINNTKKLSTLENISFKVQDATSLTYKDESFDGVVIANGLHVMPNPELALKEIHRVLKPNGLLLAPTFVYEDNSPNLKIKFLESIGFKTFTKWTSPSFSKFIEENGFSQTYLTTIKNGLLPECILIAKKQ